MAMEQWELLQRKRGNTAAAEGARALRQQFGDISLDRLQRQAEQADTVRFSPENLQRLEQMGGVKLELTGATIGGFIAQKRPVRLYWKHLLPSFKDIESMRSEVVIFPDNLIIPKSHFMPFPQQEQLMRRYSEKLQEETPGVEAIIGSVADYVELSFQYYDRTDRYLFGEDYGYPFARTKTEIYPTHLMVVGNFSRNQGLAISDGGDDRLGPCASPIIVPKR